VKPSGHVFSVIGLHGFGMSACPVVNNAITRSPVATFIFQNFVCLFIFFTFLALLKLFTIFGFALLFTIGFGFWF